VAPYVYEHGHLYRVIVLCYAYTYTSLHRKQPFGPPLMQIYWTCFYITACPLHRLWLGPMAQQGPRLQDLRLREVSHSKDM